MKRNKVLFKLASMVFLCFFCQLTLSAQTSFQKVISYVQTNYGQLEQLPEDSGQLPILEAKVHYGKMVARALNSGKTNVTAIADAFDNPQNEIFIKDDLKALAPASKTDAPKSNKEIIKLEIQALLN